MQQARNNDTHVPPVHRDNMTLQDSSANNRDGDKALAAEIRAASDPFNFNSVRVFQRVFDRECQDNSRVLTFNSAVALLDKLNFKYYGDGKYPLSHYLREIVGSRTTVTF